MMENQYENVKAALRWANQMEEAFQTQTNMLCRNAINSGGAQPFEEIFRRHHRRVYSVCLRMTGNSTEAEDLTQDVFVQVFRKLGSFRHNSNQALTS